MKSINKLVRLSVIACLYMFVSLQSAFADDTEIFFAPPSAANQAKANILFVIDTSGSMAWGVSGTTDSRIKVVQDVMSDVLTDLTNVNAGLMRFNNGKPGGILFPVLDIDKESTPTAFQTISAGENDGSEIAVVGTTEVTSSTLEFNGINEYVGVRFEDLNIPQGATILSANVLFTADRNTSGASDVIISAENVDSAVFINPITNELSNRAGLNPTAATEVWTIEDWSDGQIYSTVDISDIVEEVVARPGWCGGNDFMLFFKQLSGAKRNAYSKDGIDASPVLSPDDPASIFSPRIKIEYSETFNASANKCMTNDAVSQVSAQGDDFEIRQDGVTVYSNSSDLEFYLDGSNAQQGVGMVFRNIKVPKDAIINYAYLSFAADEDSFAASDVNISMVDADTVSPPTTSGQRLTLFNQSSTSDVPWSIADNWVTGNIYQSADISSIVAQITSRSGWSLDNNMAVFIRGLSGGHIADSFSGVAPKLHIGFKGIWQPGVNTIRDDLKAAVASLVPSGGTPISGTYAEAGSYFKGDQVFYGTTRNNNRHSRVSHPLSYSSSGTVLRASGCTDANLDATACETETITGSPNYESPITESCQQSHIVFLTDGSSNSHLSSTNAIYGNWSNGGTCTSNNGGNDCSIKMAGWLHNNDVAPGISGTQTITTHMIGFGSSADPVLMEEMATAGGGGHYSPTNKADLVKVLNSIVGGIASINSTFVTSGVTVNQYNRVTNNEERFFSLFTPVNKESWPGNIKKYKLLGSELIDANNALAIDPTSSEFSATAKSFWSASADGNDVERGGAAEQLFIGRSVYSNISSDNLATDGANALRQTNGSITASLLGGVTSQRRDTILYWVSGYDVNDPAYNPADSSSLSSTPARKDIGDPLHSQPSVIQYNDSSGALTTTRIFVGTNHGFLHSLDADNGKEKWAFVPQDLLPRLDSIVTNSTAAQHSYGLDGSVSLYLDDANGNGAVDAGSDKLYLYIGERRGGNSYYALDITNPDYPKFMFQITNTGAYSSLGQTWSKPVIAKMNLPGVNADKLVMIFGGGYDDAQDIAGTSANTDSVGDNLYIADAYTGALLWDAKNDALANGGVAGAVSSMNSVPSTVSAFDLSDDGYIDHIYITDTKAQVFRFDADNVAQTIKGGRIAHMQNVADAANNRRFYYDADTALIRQVGDSFIAVSIGSGYRAHPLDLTVDDSFYVIKDKGVLNGNFDMDASLSDLQDITSLTDSDGNGVSDAVEVLNDPISPKKGWYLNFSTSGEKVLARSVTFNNAVLFTTYIPPSGVASACEAAAGGGRLYALNILNGNPYLDTNTDGSLDENDRLFNLQTPGIAPQVDISIGADGSPIVSSGREFFSDLVPEPTPGILGYKWRKN